MQRRRVDFLWIREQIFKSYSFPRSYCRCLPCSAKLKRATKQIIGALIFVFFEFHSLYREKRADWSWFESFEQPRLSPDSNSIFLVRGVYFCLWVVAVAHELRISEAAQKIEAIVMVPALKPDSENQFLCLPTLPNSFPLSHLLEARCS